MSSPQDGTGKVQYYVRLDVFFYLLDYISLSRISKCGDGEKIKLEMWMKYDAIHNKS